MRPAVPTRVHPTSIETPTMRPRGQWRGTGGAYKKKSGQCGFSAARRNAHQTDGTRRANANSWTVEMTPYNHLLCPVDFSESSRRALEWSSRFSKAVGARLTVLHVVDTGLLSLGNLLAVPEAFDELRRRTGEAVLELKRNVGLTHAAVESAEGVPEDAVVNAANRGDVDLLVMGTRGFSGFQKFLLGSVTDKVLHRAQVPLLSISPRFSGQAFSPALSNESS